MHTKSSPKIDRFSAVYGLLLYYVLLLIYLFGFFRFRIFFLIEYEQLTEYIVADDDQNCGAVSYTHLTLPTKLEV